MFGAWPGLTESDEYFSLSMWLVWASMVVSGCSDFLWGTDFPQSECSKGKKVEVASFLRPGPENWHPIISTVF